MGDVRFGEPYRRVREAQDRKTEIFRLEDDEVVQALAHASRERDPVLANVLATEALNRMRRARTAFNHIGEGLIAVDAAGSITSVNPTACRLLSAPRETLLGRAFEEAIAPRRANGEPFPSRSSAVVLALDDGVVVETDTEHYTRQDGSFFPVSVIAAPIREEGEVHGAVATFLDISARRAAEASRAAIIESSLDAIVTIDAEGTVLEFNAAAERMFERRRGDALGKRLAELIVPPELRAAHLAGVRRVAEGGPSHVLGKRIRLPALRADGTTFPVELAITQLPGVPTRFTGFIRDLTEEVAAKEAARAAHERYAQMVARSPLSTQIFMPDGVTIATNPAWERLWGITLAELGAYNLLQDPQLERKGITPYLRRALAGETVFLPPIRYDPAESTIAVGRARWVEAHAYPLLDAEGRVDAVVLVHDDVTDRVEAGQRSALTHTQAQLLLEHVQDFAICMLDAEGRVSSWNPGSARLNGYEAHEILGKHLRTFYPLETHARGDAERALENASREGVAHEDVWLVRKDGTRYFASTSLTAIRQDGKLVGFAKVVRDLTQRRAVEERLREQERMYRDLVENSPEPMGVHAQGKLVFLNKAGAQLLGASSPQDLIGRDVIDFVHPESRALVLQRLRAMATSAAVLPPAEEKLLRLDGTPVDVETVAIPIRYEGRPAVQLILRDITHRKAAEHDLRQFHAALKQRVEERTRQLQQALRDLETFTNSASHDLRAPLRGTGVLASELERALADGDPAEARELVRLLRAENDKAVRLVHDLLAFAKSGQQDIALARVDVTAMAREAAADIAHAHPDRRTTWAIEDGMEARADPALLRIALQNLLSNASKYSASASRPTVEVRAVREGKGTTISVTDNGVGFAPQDAHRLFAPFSRLGTAQGFEGTGLGLVTVHRIATRHGGRVSGEGTVGGGATFRLWLPDVDDQ